VFEFGAEDVHFAAVLENDFVVEAGHGFFCLVDFCVLDEGFPNFGLLEDEYFDDGAVGAEELVEVVVGDDVSELVVDADQQYSALFQRIVATAHIILHKNNEITVLPAADTRFRPYYILSYYLSQHPYFCELAFQMEDS
jgi:hypothetical protein